MKQVTEFLRVAFPLMVIAFLIWFYLEWGSQKQVTKEYWENPNFKTDSLKVDVDYSKLPTPTYKNYVPPRVVVQYTPPDPPGVSVNMNDSLITVIDSLQNQIYTISAIYLKLYPNAPKLIYGEFKPDSIKLDLLYTDGKIYSSTFGVNYNRFDYQWKDGQFRAIDVNRKEAGSRFSSSLYGYGGWDIMQGSAIIGADYSISKAKVRLKANTFVTIEQQPQWNLQGTIGYKLYGRD